MARQLPEAVAQARHAVPVAHAVFPERFEEAEAQGRAVAGTPDKVREFLQRTIDEGGP